MNKSYQYTVLLLEDEVDSADLLTDFLELSDFNVLLAADGPQALEYIQNKGNQIDIAVLDIMVPPPDGYEICKQIRQHPTLKEIPVIFLTAKDKEKDEIAGLELGADDYIAKPAGGKLVVTRLQKLLARREPAAQKWLQYETILLDKEAKEAFVDNEKMNLTSTEFILLELLIEHPRRVFSRQEILEYINEDDKFVFDRTVDAHIKNLRLKLGDAGQLIKTHRGLGYGLR